MYQDPLNWWFSVVTRVIVAYPQWGWAIDCLGFNIAWINVMFPLCSCYVASKEHIGTSYSQATICSAFKKLTVNESCIWNKRKHHCWLDYTH